MTEADHPAAVIAASIRAQLQAIRERDAQCRDREAMTQAESDRRFLLRAVENAEGAIGRLNQRIATVLQMLEVARARAERAEAALAAHDLHDILTEPQETP